MGAVSGLHVSALGRVCASRADAPVHNNTPALVEDLDGVGADADIDLVAGQGMGDAVEGVSDLDVVVDVDTGLAPRGILVALARQRLERRTVQLLEPGRRRRYRRFSSVATRSLQGDRHASESAPAGSSAAIDFTAGEMTLLRALITGPPPLNRHALSREFCRSIGWFKPDSGLKDMMAQMTMLTDRPATARPNAYTISVFSSGVYRDRTVWGRLWG